jgi:NADH-quinone oxidoreductase subunit F
VRGAGAYICGEETAIFNSIEGHRGEPRNKPPFPFEVGLFGKPTAVNNVETLANVPGIVLHGHAANRRLFCLSGAVVRPGVYEVELGITLGQLIELAGGMRAGSELQSVLLGGAAGGFAGPGDLDLVLDQDSTRTVGLTLGSGVVMVHDQHVDLVDQLKQIAAFFRDESCGQCVPCRVGTVRQEEAIERLAHSASEGDLSLLREIGQAMRDASICGLGQTAANAIDSAIVRLGVFQR